ncbi:MAG TPA: AAA family ATPase [Solirubrobacteraceae bacterium]|nr:AAA family ATPase [Solirubrobacteraceae bacterium]
MQEYVQESSSGDAELPRMLEREAELAAIERAFAGASAGHGALVVIEGPSGIGKSALVHAAVRLAEESGMRVRRARGAELERDAPYAVVSQLLGDADLLSVLAEAAPLAGDGAAHGLIDASARTLLARDSLWRRLTDPAPALLAIDDLHWADPESVGVLQFAATRLEQRPLVLLLACRPTEPNTDWEALMPLVASPGVLTLRPQPLSTGSVARMLALHGVASATQRVAVASREVTGGNPFLVCELARTLVAEGVADDEQRAAEAVRELAPAGLGRAVLARLAALSPSAHTLACSLAVLGGRAELELGARLAGLSADEAAHAADLLADIGLVGSGRPVEFAHPMMRAAVYRDMRPAERQALHRRAALLIDQLPAGDRDLVAAHLLHADPSEDRWVVDALERAARQALERSAPEAAARYVGRALREPPPAERQVELLCLMGEARLRAGEPDPAIDVLEAALERCATPVDRARVTGRLQQALTYAQRGDLGARLLAEAIDGLPASERELGLSLEAQLQLACKVHLVAARVAGSRTPRFTAQAQEPRTRGERLALAALASIESGCGTAARTAQLASLALGEGALLDCEGPDSPLLHLAAYALMHADRLQDADRELTRMIEEAHARHSLFGEAVARGLRAECAYRRGALGEVSDDARFTLSALRYGLRFGPRPAAGALVMTLIDRGELMRARAALGEHGFDGSLAPAATTVWLAAARARLEAALGRHERALADLGLCARIAEEFRVTSPVLAVWESDAALSLHALGRDGEAAEQASAGVSRARAFGGPRALGMALTVQGRLGRDLSALEEAVAVLAASEARLEHARALLALGAEQRRRGQRGAACEHLSHSLALARDCDAPALAAQAYDELKAAGAHPRRILRHGADTLTASERRVAQLAADGLSNAGIARELNVSVRTVESHLAHAYRKLGIQGRGELGPALAHGEHRASVHALRRP